MTFTHTLRLYSFLAQFRLLRRSYIAKIMTVAFLGTHVPLLALLLTFLLSHSYSWDVALQVLIIALIATLIGTAATLYALHQLLTPVILTSSVLQKYLNTKTLPELPTQFKDEAGTLMANTSQTLHKLDELIHYISNYDALTGLPNRDLFGDRLKQALAQSQHHNRLLAVLYVGIDEFDHISSAWSAETTSLMLRAVAQRLTSCINSTDLVARLDKDEFAIALTELPTLENVIKLSQLILRVMAKPFIVDRHLIHITASLGITLSSLEDNQNVEQLLQQSHIALFTARRQGRSQYEFYSPEITAQLQERFTLENELHRALERQEIQVYYQPLINLHKNEIVAVEALMRWQHPTLGLISPAKFIPIAEANGVIVSLGEWVLRTACAQNRAWQMLGLAPIRVSVNLSACQFEQPNLVKMVQQILEESELSASHLELEVTESSLMIDVQKSIATLEQLQSLGIVLALDDFGTGYSSLNYLKRFPINMLKIDKSFIQDVTTNPDSAAVTDAIIALAKSMKLEITAEGIETAEQLNYLRMRNCQEGQGFYFSRPVPADAMTEMLQKSCQTLKVS